MADGSGAHAQAVDPGNPGSGPPTSLPWAQIPRFDPSTTDLRVYEQKMKFLHSIWPEEHLQYLGPRAALLVEGAAFQKVARLDGAKLQSKQGVQYLVEALGGQWGRLGAEEKYDLFERALYTVVQKGDESNNSYLARHDIAFEDLESKGVTIKDIRAYILVRQSTLSPEDRKKIIMDNAGDLTYEAARKSLKLLGSKFFQELQGSTKGQVAKKSYEAYNADEIEEASPAFFQEADGEWDEESVYQLMADNGDEDAIYINEFEDQIVEAVQEHPDLSHCFVSYQEARARVRERARARGFWPIKGKAKGKGFTKKGKGVNTFNQGSTGFMGRKRSLAERIANSTCRLCGMAGHWKRECPQRAENKKPEQSALNEVHLGFLDEDDIAQEVIEVLPPDAVDWKEGQNRNGFKIGLKGNSHDHEALHKGHVNQFWDVPVFDTMMVDRVTIGSKFSQDLCNRLQRCGRKHRESVVVTSKTFPCHGESESTLSPNPSDLKASVKTTQEAETVFQFEEESHEAIIDTGASRAVVGSDRLSSLIASCGMEGKVKVVPSNVVFRFGNSGTLKSNSAVFFPRKTGGWIRVEVVPGQTPFLLSNSVLRALKAIIDVEGGMLWFKGCTTGVPLKPCRKNLMSVRFKEILTVTPESYNGESDEIHMTTQNTSHDLSNKCHTAHPGNMKTMDDVQEMTGHQVSHEVNEYCRIASPAAVCSSKSSSQSSHHSGKDVQPNDRSQLSGPSPRLQSGSEPHDAQEGVRDPSGGVPKATGSEHPPRVGSDDSPGRETQGQDLRTGLHRPELRLSTPKSKGNISMGQELSDVWESEGAPRLHSLTRDVRQGNPCDHGDAQSDREGRKFDSDSKGLAKSRAEGTDQYEIRRMGESQRKTCSKGRPSQAPSLRDDERRSFSVVHADGTQCRESATYSNADCSAPTGTGQRDADPKRCRVNMNDEIANLVSYIDSNTPLPRLTAVQEKLIHQELALKVAEIQDGLSTLPKNAGKMENQHDLKTGNKNGHSQSRPLDLLEVYCGPNSQITNHVNKRGGRAKIFTYNDGDLGTLEGVQKLWLWIYMYEPRHIWLAPECRLWGKFSNLNMSKSHELCERIVRERLQNKHHLRLCNEIYLYQSWKRRHAHLEQPNESSMMSQEELNDFRQGSLQSTFDMCRVGKLRLPRKGDFLQKRTSVNTTSGYLDFHLNQKYCKHDHAHGVIQGSMKHEGQRINVTEYASPYTSIFGAFVAGKIMEECRIKEPPVVLFENPHDVFAVDQNHESPDLAPEDSQSQKRRRYGIKGPPRGPDVDTAGSPPRGGYGKSPTWEGVIKGLASTLPRVGNLILKSDDPKCADFQALVPELQVKLVLLCRGTERYRVPGSLAGPNEMPWRKTPLVEFVEDQTDAQGRIR